MSSGAFFSSAFFSAFSPGLAAGAAGGAGRGLRGLGPCGRQRDGGGGEEHGDGERDESAHGAPPRSFGLAGGDIVVP